MSPTTDDDYLLKGASTWASLKFDTAWMQLDSGADSFYFEDVDSDVQRIGMYNKMVTAGAAYSDCRMFLGDIGSPGSGGTVATNCGSANPSVYGPMSDPPGTGAGYCWWTHLGPHLGAGGCGPDHQSAGHTGYLWVRGGTGWSSCGSYLCLEPSTLDGSSREKPATSCSSILSLDSSRAGQDGQYWLAIAPAYRPFQAYCDMTSNGGGDGSSPILSLWLPSAFPCTESLH